MKTGQTRANEVIDRLLALSPVDVVNALAVAREYADHPSIHNVPNIPAGKRLLIQLEFALDEVEAANADAA